LADWLPEPLTVPTRMARSLIEAGDDAAPSETGNVSTKVTVDAMMGLDPAGHYVGGLCARMGQSGLTTLAEAMGIGVIAVHALT